MAVTDQFSGDFVTRQHRAGQSRIAIRHRSHAIEQVRRLFRTGGDRRLSNIERGTGVSKRDARAPFGELTNEVDAAGQFRRAHYGRVVNVASIEALRGRFGLSNYAASKAGLIAFTRSAAVELGRYGVNVNAVAPGFIRTPLVERLPEKVRAQAVAETALGRMGEPEDVANAVAFLCSERARHITGAVLTVDGGQLL